MCVFELEIDDELKGAWDGASEDSRGLQQTIGKEESEVYRDIVLQELKPSERNIYFNPEWREALHKIQGDIFHPIQPPSLPRVYPLQIDLHNGLPHLRSNPHQTDLLLLEHNRGVILYLLFQQIRCYPLIR